MKMVMFARSDAGIEVDDERNYFKKLPLEMKLEILTRLPAELVFDCKSVCTNWNDIISNNSSFSKMHSDRHHFDHLAEDSSSCKLGFLSLNDNNSFYHFEYKDVDHDEDGEDSSTRVQRIQRIKFTSPFTDTRFIGSCNGLVCLVSYNHQSVCIFNPITREYVLLPEIKNVIPTSCNGISYYKHTVQHPFGFGYVSSTNEYKVLVIFVKETKVQEVYIYTLGSGSGWRNLGNFDFEFDFRGWNGIGMFANEALYWMDGKLEMIVTFDLVKEKFCEHLSPPPAPMDNGWENSGIGVLNGVLYFALFYYDYDDDEEEYVEYEIWLLKRNKHNHDKEEGEEHQSFGWTKECRMGQERDLLALTKSAVFFAAYGYLELFNRKTETHKSLVEFKNKIMRVLRHENTLVSLKELKEEDTKVMESVEETKSHEQLQEDVDSEYTYL